MLRVSLFTFSENFFAISASIFLRAESSNSGTCFTFVSLSGCCGRAFAARRLDAPFTSSRCANTMSISASRPSGGSTGSSSKGTSLSTSIRSAACCVDSARTGNRRSCVVSLLGGGASFAPSRSTFVLTRSASSKYESVASESSAYFRQKPMLPVWSWAAIGAQFWGCTRKF